MSAGCMKWTMLCGETEWLVWVLFEREVGKSPASFLFIRAIPWVLTHPHGNSYACRAEFSEISLYSKINL